MPAFRADDVPVGVCLVSVGLNPGDVFQAVRANDFLRAVLCDKGEKWDSFFKLESVYNF
jgi:hypothetical protein